MGATVYWLKLKPLKDELTTQGLAEGDKYKYVLAWGLVMAVLPFAGMPFSGTYQVLVFWAEILITFLGIRYAYNCNGGEAGTSFLERYFSIGWVINLRVFLVLTFLVGPAVRYLTPLHQLGAFLDNIVSGLAALIQSDAYMDGTGTEGLEAITIVIAEIYVFWAVGKNIGDVRAADLPAPLVQPGFAPMAPGAPPTRMALRPPISPPAPLGGVLMTPDHLTPQASSQLERFVETVVQRELATAPPPTPSRGIGPRRTKAPAKRKLHKKR